MGEEKPKKKGPVTIAISLPWLAAGAPPPTPGTAAASGEAASAPTSPASKEASAASDSSTPVPTPDAPPLGHHEPPLASLRAFLERRLAQARRTHELFGDRVAEAEVELCQELLAEQQGDRAAMTALYRW